MTDPTTCPYMIYQKDKYHLCVLLSATQHQYYIEEACTVCAFISADLNYVFEESVSKICPKGYGYHIIEKLAKQLEST